MPFVLSYPDDAAERVEGEPFYQLAAYSIQDNEHVPSVWRDFKFCVRAYKVLPPCDAVALLSGDDATGLVVWSGALALLEWLLLNPGQLNVAATTKVNGSNDIHFIELGCGSGIATVGLHALLVHRTRVVGADDKDRLTARVHLWATDGNPECVRLAARNVSEQCSNEQKESLNECGGGWATVSVAELHWGDTDAIKQLLRKSIFVEGRGTSASSCASRPAVIVVSADVLYDAAAVPLLVSTVVDIADTCFPAEEVTTELTRELTWWLVYTPRSLTRAGNEHIFQTLMETLGRLGWRYEVFPLPDGAVSTGFESRADCDTPALRGCILVVHATAVVSTGRS